MATTKAQTEPEKSFDGLDRQPPPARTVPDWQECPCCEGHGRWIYRRDAYRPGVHAVMTCFQCQGSGWLPPGHIHKWHYQRPVGRCRHEWRCDCGAVREVDGSD